MRRDTSLQHSFPLSVVRFLLLLIQLSFLVVVVTAQEKKSWTGCNAVTNSTTTSGVSMTTDIEVSIGKSTCVCLHIGDSVDWASGEAQYIRTHFQPIADQYSYFHIPYSYSDLKQETSDYITVGAASQSALSFVRVYIDNDKGKVYPYLTAILNVKNGIVNSITWDDGCVFCGGFGESCEENTYNYDGIPQNQSSAGQPTKSCFIKTETCDEIIAKNENATECDIKLYTVWSGTDKNGNAFQSQAFRFSMFPVQDMTDWISSKIPTFGLTTSTGN